MKAIRIVVSVLLLFLVLPQSLLTAQRSCPTSIRDADACEAFIEKELLKEFPNLFRRNGPKLMLRFSNKTEEVFVDGELIKGDESSSRSHRLADYYQKINYVLLAIGFYESRGYDLVNTRSGKHADIPGKPVFSSDGTRFAVARDAGASGLSGIDSLSVYRVAAGGVSREFFQEIEQRSVEDLRWRGNAAVSFVDVDWASRKETRRTLRGKPAANGTVVWKIE